MLEIPFRFLLIYLIIEWKRTRQSYLIGGVHTLNIEWKCTLYSVISKTTRWRCLFTSFTSTRILTNFNKISTIRLEIGKKTVRFHVENSKFTSEDEYFDREHKYSTIYLTSFGSSEPPILSILRILWKIWNIVWSKTTKKMCETNSLLYSPKNNIRHSRWWTWWKR